MNLKRGYSDNTYTKKTLDYIIIISLLFVITWTYTYVFYVKYCKYFLWIYNVEKNTSNLNALERIIYSSDLIGIVIKL